MREQYMRCGEGFIVCYSITDRHSFLECEEYRNLIIKVRAQDNVPIILVANKVDLDQGNNKCHQPNLYLTVNTFVGLS